MALTQKETDDIIKFVKQEPRTIQDISKLIGRSWVTTDSYAAQIKERTGLVNIKTFRKGSQGALKIAFYNHKESSVGDDVKEELLSHIKINKIITLKTFPILFDQRFFNKIPMIKNGN